MTVRELIAIHEQERDEAFKKKYPNGRFTVQRDTFTRWNSDCKTFSKSTRFGIYFRRQRAREPVMGVETFYGDIRRVNYQNSAFGKVTHYDNLEACLKAAVKFGLPDNLIKLFEESVK